MEPADGDCLSSITTATGKAVRGFITSYANGNMEVIASVFLKYAEMEYDMLGMFTARTLDCNYDKRESVNQRARGIYVKDKASYGSILWSSASAPATAVIANTAVPASYAMSIYPKPFNPTATIAYTLAKPEAVSIKVYSTAGKLVAQLLNNELQNAGTHEVTFDGSSPDSGVFFYRLQTASAAFLGKMTLIKQLICVPHRFALKRQSLIGIAFLQLHRSTLLQTFEQHARRIIESVRGRARS